jgi:hypothetical protein
METHCTFRVVRTECLNIVYMSQMINKPDNIMYTTNKTSVSPVIELFRRDPTKSPHPSPENGNRSSVRNVVFLVICKIPDGGQSPESQ